MCKVSSKSILIRNWGVLKRNRYKIDVMTCIQCAYLLSLYMIKKNLNLNFKFCFQLEFQLYYLTLLKIKTLFKYRNNWWITYSYFLTNFIKEKQDIQKIQIQIPPYIDYTPRLRVKTNKIEFLRFNNNI